MLCYEVQTAHEAAQEQDGKPKLLPVRVNDSSPLPEPLESILGPLHYTLWEGPQDSGRVVEELVRALRGDAAAAPPAAAELEAVGGAVPLDSQFYIVRPTDDEFHAAVARRD